MHTRTLNARKIAYACVTAIDCVRASQEMAVTVRVLLAALLGLYWSSSRVAWAGNQDFDDDCIYNLTGH